MLLPAGVEVRPLEPHADYRGSFTELYRASWFDGRPRPVQWNLVRSAATTLRGVHVHIVHSDYWTLATGAGLVGLCDLRRRSPTFRLAAAIPVYGDEPQMIVIPPGVAHGFLFYRTSTHVYAVSSYWDVADELGCRWDDSELGIPWTFPGVVDPLVSPRDRDAGSLRELMNAIEPRQSGFFARA